MEQEPFSQKPYIDFDGRWKTIIEELFDDFMAFFMPELFEEIDFTKEVLFLDKELQTIMPQTERKGKKIGDCLAKVFLKSGEEKWILVHIEVQSSYKANFSARMFKYFYRIFDKFGQKIAAIAIFTDDKHPKNYNIYRDEFFGTRITYEYNAYKISEQTIESLQNQTNPFALAILANKYVLASKNKKHQRLQFKINLLKLMRKQKFSKRKMLGVFNFVKYLLILPNDLELEFDNYNTENYKNHTDMREPVIQPNELALMDRFNIIKYGDTVENLLAKLEEKAVAEAQKAEQEREKAEQEREKAEQEREKAEQEREKAEQEREKAEQERENTIMNLHRNLSLSALQIADALKIKEEQVKAIIEKNTTTE
ncbi:MAG: hypothetical protein ACPG5B_01035 [Chitinophagales bacterium]